MRERDMTLEQIEEMLRDLDWTEVHRLRVFSDYGSKVVIHADGDFSVLGSSTYYRDPEEAGVIAYLPCWGTGNIDRTDYFEGFVERFEEETSGRIMYRDIHDGRVLAHDEALAEAIRDGEWDYDAEIDMLMADVRQRRSEGR